MDLTAVADHLEAQLAALAVPGRAEHERRYLKSELTHLGVSVPTTRKVATTVYRSLDEVTHQHLVGLVAALWEKRVHERRMAAVDLLELGIDRLSIEDAPLLEHLLRESRTWGLLDGLAASVVGPLVDREPAAWDPVVRHWAADDDFWVRRASLLAHLLALRRGEGDFRRFGQLADPMLDDPEFFIRKAIGWVLRDTGKRRPQLVASWLAPRAARASGLTVREAVRHLPDAQRDEVLAARDD